MKPSTIKLLPPPTPTSTSTSTQILSPTSRVGNDYLSFWSELKKKSKQVTVKTPDETQTTPQPQARPFVPKSHSLTDYDGINEFFQGMKKPKKPKKSNPLLFFLFMTLLLL